VFHQCLVLNAAAAVALVDAATVPVLLSMAAGVVEKRRL
jgi:hypothetical protein